MRLRTVPAALGWYAALWATTAPTAVMAGDEGGGGTVWITPHDSYSSSVGVLGCKVDTNRIAYWPASVDCDDVCVEVALGGRTVTLLRVDQSQGAYDISYDAWNYLQTGASARDQPTAGGAVAATWRRRPVAACAGLLRTPGNRLPLSAANSMNFLSDCLAARPASWVARHHVLYNVLDPLCAWGRDEECALPPGFPVAANQPACPAGTLGVPDPLTVAHPVYNIRYPTGEEVNAVTGAVVEHGSRGGAGPRPSLAWVMVFGAVVVGMVSGSAGSTGLF